MTNKFDNKLKGKRVLFVCMYGQSRSRWFAEKFMELGIKAMYCGHYTEHADFPITKHHIDWADEIVLLDKDIKRTVHYDVINKSGKVVLENFIEDEPHKFEKFLETSGLKQKYLNTKEKDKIVHCMKCGDGINKDNYGYIDDDDSYCAECWETY